MSIEALFTPKPGAPIVSREPVAKFCECCEQPRYLAQFHADGRYGDWPICIFCNPLYKPGHSPITARVCSPCDRCRLRGPAYKS